MSQADFHTLALRNDFMVFYAKCFAQREPGVELLDNWHLHAIAESLRRVAVGVDRRLVINVPPRSGKSTLVTIAFTAWLLGLNPRLRIICVSFSEDLARTHASAFRSIVKSDWYRRAFPAFRIARAGDRAVETVTTEHGYRYAVSISGSVVGRGADIIIGDDAMSPDAALSEAVRVRELAYWDIAHRPRLTNKKHGAIILVSQRLHQDDLVGHVLATGDWKTLIIPAVATEPARFSISPKRFYDRAAGEVLDARREPREVLDEMHLAMGSMAFNAQYMQEPVPPEGAIIKRQWLCYYEDEPAEFDMTVASWDTASTIEETSSFSVGMHWGSIGADYYLLDIVRGRFETPDLRRLIIRCQEAWEPDATLIEDTELGRSLAQDLRRTETWRPIMRRPRFDKTARLLAQAARFEAKQVHLLSSAEWLGTYEAELLAFPFSKHDDQVDATSQALNYFTSRLRLAKPTIRGNIKRRSIVRRPAVEKM